MVGKKLFVQLTWNLCQALSKEQKDLKARDLSTKKIAQKTFDFLYFLSITLYGWYLLSKNNFFPPMLGGNHGGTFMNTWKSFPTGINNELKTYFLISFGYHIQSMFHLMETHFESPRADFKEMLIHHLVTLAVCFGGYITYFHAFGFMVAHVHDHADVTTSFVKAIAEMRYKTILAIFALLNILVWIYTRCIVYPVMLWQGWWTSMEPVMWPNASSDPK